jgi:formyltetrahydrofolate synthetase
MTENPIVEEIHRIREEMLAEYGGDLAKLLKDAQRRTEQSARSGRVVKSAPTKPAASGSGESQRKVG